MAKDDEGERNVAEKLQEDFHGRFSSHPHGAALKRMIIAAIVLSMISIVTFFVSCLHFTLGFFIFIWLIFILFTTVDAPPERHEFCLGLIFGIYLIAVLVCEAVFLIVVLALLGDDKKCNGPTEHKVVAIIMHSLAIAVTLFIGFWKGHPFWIYKNGGLAVENNNGRDVRGA